MPIEVMKYTYQKLFGLTSQELEAEPTDKFFTNLHIYALIEKKREAEIRNATKSG